MTKQKNIPPCRIARRAGEQGARSQKSYQVDDDDFYGYYY